MLSSISIKNFTIIDELHLDFNKGLSIITGETGAGKSIIIDALALVLGGRADSLSIRVNQERCDISASFDIEDIANAQHWLKKHGLDNTQSECILHRIINRDSKTRSLINGQITPLHQMRELGNLLIDIHGQHEHQALLRNDHQRVLLDQYANHKPLLLAVEKAYSTWQEIHKELTRLKALNQGERLNYLQYQLQELEQNPISAEEYAVLSAEHTRLANSEHITQQTQSALSLLQEDEVNCLSMLHQASHLLASAKSLEPRLNSTADLLNNAAINLQEAASELRHHLDRMDADPEHFNLLEQRLNAIHNLARKHRIKPEELASLYQRLTEEYVELIQVDERIQELQIQLTQALDTYQTAARKLSLNRQKTGKKLSQFITEYMQKLGMPGGQCSIEFRNRENLTLHGIDEIEFKVSTNPGQPFQALAKVASGGELSRISLAIQVITAEKENTPTLIFDEADVGIGGGTAEVVGQLLHTLCRKAQVLCITHLPQVAAQGDHHLQISKYSEANETFAKVKTLNAKERIEEIARMLGGVKITEQTLAHAKEMLSLAIKANPIDI